jgi:YggT family protein
VSLLFDLLGVLLFVFFVFLIARLVLDWIQVFARDWRPTGVLLVLSEAVYSVTDPPLNAIRRVVKPIRLGQIQLDLAFIVLFLAVVILRSVVEAAAVATS